MGVQLVALAEQTTGEHRVAISPDTVKRYKALGFSVAIEAGAGLASAYTDAAYQAQGADIGDKLAQADIVLCVQPPAMAQLEKIKSGAHLVGLLAPLQDPKQVAAYAAQGIDTYAMELIPRITRAQSMDVLSSQSNLAGYKAVLDATAEYQRALPMMMTAAGTVPAARVFVLGAGVAGLQAIATAKRLGAIVSATDVRAAAREQVESLGASFVMVEQDEGQSGETAAGYAQEMSADYQKRQAALIEAHIAKQDIVICTALVFGRAAPVLVRTAMIRSMQPGSVIVDLAVEQGGNVEGSQAGEIVEMGGVKILGHRNVPSRLAASASALYARNLYQFVSSFYDEAAGALNFSMADDIIQAVCVTHGGKVIHPLLTKQQAAKAQG